MMSCIRLLEKSKAYNVGGFVIFFLNFFQIISICLAVDMFARRGDYI